MDLEEVHAVRAEIERRKQKAKDLKLCNQVGLLYRVYFDHVIKENLQKDPKLVLPEIRKSLKQSKNETTFRFNGSDYRLVHTASATETDYSGNETKSCTVMFQANGETVFEFLESDTYFPNSMSPYKSTEEITAFIDGDWVTEIRELMQQLDTYRQEKNLPKEAEQLKQEMKRFGL